MRRSLRSGLFSVISEEEPDRELDENGEERVRERPDEDANERVANERIREDRLEVLEAHVRLPARLEKLAGRRLVRALAVVRVHDPRLDVGERVGGRVVAQSRLHLVRDAEPFRLDVRVLTRRDDERGQFLVDREEVVPLDDVVALHCDDDAVLDRRTRRRNGLEAVLRADVDVSGHVVDEQEHELAVARRRSRRVGCRVDSRNEGPLLDRDDRLVLSQVVQRRPVGERDVDVRDDRDRHERDEEHGARDQVLERHEAPVRNDVDRDDHQRRGG